MLSLQNASGNRSSGSNSIFMGYYSRGAENNTTNEIVIGHYAIGKGSNTATIGNSDTTDIYLSQDSGATIYGGTFSGSAFIDDGTQLNVPDYVFESDYDLLRLE